MPSTEQITAFELRSPDRTFSMNRDEFYDEQIQSYKKTGKSTKGICVAEVLLFDSKGELYIQKRSSVKRHNPNLFR